MPHKLGQVFLIDANILRKIILQTNPLKEDTIVEIGCGEGVLTEAIAPLCQKLIVLELDSNCIEKTKEKTKKEPNISFYETDVLKFDLGKLNKNVRVIANIPYYISAKIIKWLIEYKEVVTDATLMVQKEFAKKITANPGESDYTSLTVYTRFFFDVKYNFTVSKNSFFPIPKVDSAIMTLIPNQKFEKINQDLFFNIVRSAFWGRRKPLQSALSKSPYLKEHNINFKELPFFQNKAPVRGETLTLNQFHKLYTEIEYLQKKTLKNNKVTNPVNRNSKSVIK